MTNLGNLWLETQEIMTKELSMITSQLTLERCPCKNPNGTYSILDALGYNAYSPNPSFYWQEIQREYAFMLAQIRFYFLADEPATDAEGITLILEMARRHHP